MYHEEKMIDGCLHWRNTPDGEWKKYTIEQLSVKYESLKSEFREFRNKETTLKLSSNMITIPLHEEDRQ